MEFFFAKSQYLSSYKTVHDFTKQTCNIFEIFLVHYKIKWLNVIVIYIKVKIKWSLVDKSNEQVYCTTKGFGRNSFTTFPMPSGPKYPFAWWCIYAISIWSTCKKIYLAPAPVSTMNARRPQPYFLARLSKWSIMYLAFGTEISNLSSSFNIYFVVWV